MKNTSYICIGNSSKITTNILFMDRTDLFIKGSLKVTITFETNSGVSLLVPFDPQALFNQIMNALMCGNDVHIYHKFEENQILL